MIKIIDNSNIEELIEWLGTQKYIVVDTETRTRGLSPIKMDLHDTELLMLQVGNKHIQWIIDCRTTDISCLKPILESNRLLKVGHNIKYDYQVLKVTNNIVLSKVHDTMVSEYVLNTGRTTSKGFYSLEKTHIRYFETNPYGDQLSLFDPYIPKSTRSKFGDGTFSTAEIFYGATDIITTDKVYEAQLLALADNDLLRVAKLENKFVLCLGDMELEGMPIDIDRWLELDEWSRNKRDEALTKLSNEFPEVKNWNSAQQVTKLFKALGIHTTVKDIAKSEKMGEDILKDSVQELVISEQAKDYPIITDYLTYKGLAKLNSTYGIKFLKHVSPITNRIHTSFQQILNTGRVASTSPNMQNIVTGKDGFEEGDWWREAFRPPKDYVFIGCDYSSQESILLAHKAQDTTMLKAIRNKQDLHKLAASALFGIAVEAVTKQQRRDGKTTNFAIAYGAGASKLAAQFNITLGAGKKLINNYYATFNGLKAYQENAFQHTIKHGWIDVDVLGRKSYIPHYNEYLYLSKLIDNNLDTPEHHRRLRTIEGMMFRDSCNYGVQGEAATMTKFACVLIRAMLKGTSGKLILTIHDEVIIQCLKIEAEQIRKIVERCMSRSAHIFCPSVKIPAEAIISNCWNK